MEDSRSSDPASSWTQADALLRKNLTYQKRNAKTNCRLISFPFVLCIILVLAQNLINREFDKPSKRCGCECVDTNGDGKCEKVCGVQYSTLDQVTTCSIQDPPEWPPMLQFPAPEYRAVRSDAVSFTDLPDEACRLTGSCPATVLATGSNQTLGQILAGFMFTSSVAVNSSDIVDSIANMVLVSYTVFRFLPYQKQFPYGVAALDESDKCDDRECAVELRVGLLLQGSSTDTEATGYLEPGFIDDSPLYNIRNQCTSNTTFIVPFQQSGLNFQKEAKCVEGLTLWRNGSSEVNEELFKGYRKGNPDRKINEILAAYDYLDSSRKKFNVNVWYNSSNRDSTGSSFNLLRVPRAVNLASNAYLKFLLGSGTQMLFEFFKDFPKPETKIRLDLSSLLGTLFFTWVVLQLFPVVLTALIYEKQQNLRIMMKMHGLGDGPYWLISYAYFLAISMLYIFVFVVFGSVIGLKFFQLNDYSIQFVFFFIYINLQISLAFLVASFFSNVKTATVVGYICVFGTGLLGGFLLQPFIQDKSFPRGWIIVLELYPGFSLYRGLYEFAQYSFTGDLMGTRGMDWGNLKDSENGMSDVLIIMLVEWFVVLLVAYYIDQLISTGSGKSPLFILQNCWKKPPATLRNPSLRRQESKVFVDMEKTDVSQERERVEQLLLESSATHAIVCDNLRKVYPGRDGNPQKLAVKGLSLALPRGECFGMLGPNGAGKTSFISMMIGLTKPSSGSAYVEGMDIRTQMNWIYTSMGVCPQHDLLWENLTGREHLLFYGRLKNLKGSALNQAVEESLKGVNLFNGGVADKQAGKYSGGMKRRLSVAISLIGDPKVVYMDEPSTGLDPASRSNLWNVVRRAKQNRAIILTTHSMEEAEVLCDRIGIFVDGGLQCIGNPKELKGRYGGSYVFTITTSSDHEQEVAEMVRRLSPGAQRTYQTSGTQKFEMPKNEARIADVFCAVEVAKSKFPVFAWGLSDTTLEDVFIKVASGA